MNEITYTRTAEYRMPNAVISGSHITSGHGRYSTAGREESPRGEIKSLYTSLLLSEQLYDLYH